MFHQQIFILSTCSIFPYSFNAKFVRCFVLEWKMDDNENNWNTGQITIFFLGLALLIGSSVLLMIIIATRRRCNESDDVRSTTKHVKLPISSSENTYTVAYQLKSESKQPDIISRGKKSFFILISCGYVFLFWCFSLRFKDLFQKSNDLRKIMNNPLNFLKEFSLRWFLFYLIFF